MGTAWTDFWYWLSSLPQGVASFLGTLTGSSIGLIALLLGAMFNARLNRRRDDRLRDEDRRALAAALHAELEGLLRYMQNAPQIAEEAAEKQEGFLLPEPIIRLFPEAMAKIGLLEAETIRKVMDGYLCAEAYAQDLILIGGQLKPDMPENYRWVSLEAEHAPLVIQLGRRGGDHVQDAINALAPYLN